MISEFYKSQQSEIIKKTEIYFQASQAITHKRTDQLFACLMIFQWIAEIIAALTISPKTWTGTVSNIHIHVWSAIFLGGIISIFPVFLVLYRPGSILTRQVITVAQMLTSSLLIHLTGGRIETHFHVFGSLALIAFYRDWTVFPTATFVVVIDHWLRGVYFPLSVYGVAYASPWRSLEHAGWVIFENVFLIWSCKISNHESREVAKKRAELEILNRSIQAKVEDRTYDLLRAQEDIKEREERLQTILHTAADAIVILDCNMRIVKINAVTEKFFGYPEEYLVGKHINVLLQETSRNTMNKILLSDGDCPADELKTSHCNLTAIGKNGTNLSVEVAMSKMMVGNSPMYTIILRDITERQMMEVQLRQAQKLESIGQLAAGIAHEINTPIQFVGDNTRFLQDEFSNIKKLLEGSTKLIEFLKVSDNHSAILNELDEIMKQVDSPYLCEEIPKAIQQSLEGIARVTHIVRAMKDFSHPGTSEKQYVDINKAIESTVVISTNEWKYVADVEMKFDSSLPLVPCLIGEFNQVILNLLVNAANAIADVKDKGTNEKGKITISTHNLGNWVEIKLQDSGIGIPKNIAHKIFDPFFTTKDVGKGTGQGLTLVQTIIINKHKGTINFESEIGKGTTFIICLPLKEGVSIGSLKKITNYNFFTGELL